jgi:hypothetical protein
MTLSLLALTQEIRNALARAVDAVTFAQIGIDSAHHEIHEGHSFTAHYQSEAPLPTNAGEETAIGFITPLAANGRVHMIIDIVADDESVWELREAPTIVLGSGSAYLALNRFRDSANESVLHSNGVGVGVANTLTTYTVAEANTANLAIGTGTILHHETIAIAAGPPFAAAGNTQSRGQREFILAASTEYVIIVTSSTANNTVHEITLNWYEHVHKNE